MNFLKSERTGDWESHLHTMQNMLPFLASSGHCLYTKSLHVYLQHMAYLPIQHPDVYAHFMKDLHVIRRSDRFWAGLSADLIIEQVLMKNMKTTGGLTRGRGMTETQRLVWVLSSPICAEVNEALQGLTGVVYCTSEQHKEISQSRQERDTAHTTKILEYLKDRNPFRDNGSLLNIANGISAESNVNVDKAKEVGEHILDEMVGQSVLGFTFRKKNQAVTLDSRSSVKIDDELVQIDPQLLFQRLIITGTQTGELAETFQYELCSYPPALFEGKGILLVPNKHILAKAILNKAHQDGRGPTDHAYVIDGGALVHRIH